MVVSSAMRLTDLSTELLLCIGEQVELESDLNSFVQASHRLYDCLNYYLYRNNVRNLGSLGLVRAAFNGSEDAVRKFLAEGANVHATSQTDEHDPMTALTLAAEQGHTHIVRLLLGTSGIDVNVDASQGTPLCYAAWKGRDAVVTLLLQDPRVDPNRHRNWGKAALHWAVDGGHDTTVQMLLNDSRVLLDPPMKENSGTVLTLALSLGHGAVAKTLLADSRIDPNAVDPRIFHKTPLMCPMMDDEVDTELIQTILQRVDRTNLDLQDDDGRTALSWAAGEGHEEAVRLLLQKGTTIDVPDDRWTGTPLSHAALNGHSEIVELLLAAGAAPNFLNHHSETPIYLAAGNDMEEAVKVLLGHPSIDPNSRSPQQGFTPLLYATQAGNHNVLKVLLSDNRVNVNAQDHEGDTALTIATQLKNLEIVDLLLAKEGVHINAKDKGGKSPLAYAVCGSPLLAERFLKREDVDLNSRDNLGMTPLILAAATETSSLAFKGLLSRKAVDVNSKDNTDRTALIWAVKFDQLKEVDLLLERQDIDVNIKDMHGECALTLAADRGNMPVLESLLAIDRLHLNARNKEEYTALALAARHGNKEIVEMLISKDGIELSPRGWDGKTPLATAAERVIGKPWS